MAAWETLIGPRTSPVNWISWLRVDRGIGADDIQIRKFGTGVGRVEHRRLEDTAADDALVLRVSGQAELIEARDSTGNVLGKLAGDHRRREDRLCRRAGWCQK